MLIPVFVSLQDSDLCSYVQWPWKFLQQQTSQRQYWTPNSFFNLGALPTAGEDVLQFSTPLQTY